MTDNFDAVDIVYNAISSYGVMVYKDKAPEGVSSEHIVVNSPTSGPSSYGTNDVNVNVNIFIPITAKGMPDRSRFKTIKNAIFSLITSANPSGYYCYIDPSFSAFIESSNKAFDCFTQRFLLTLNN